MSSGLDVRRGNDVTGSDVPAICGECPFSSERATLFKKTLNLPGFESPATAHGHKWEPVALKAFVDATGAVLTSPGYKQNEERWIGGTVDSLGTVNCQSKNKFLQLLVPDMSLEGVTFVVEVKCPVSRKIGDFVPTQYVGQLQTYMYLWDAPVCFFVQFKPQGPRSLQVLMITAVKRDREYMNIRMPKLYTFWCKLQTFRAYVNRVVTVIQRAWRLHRIVKGGMICRLKCANTVGKISGFMRGLELAKFRAPANLDPEVCYVVCPASLPVIPRWKRKRQYEPDKANVCNVIID